MFCQLEMIRSCLPQNVRRILQELPASLDETYARMLRELMKVNPDQVYRLLQFLTVATRPVSVVELAEILALDFSETEDGIPVLKKDLRWDHEQQNILATCSSLIIVVDSDDELGRNTRVVRFAHFSVKEFLTSERLANIKEDISRFHIRLEPAHTIAAQSCLAILLQSDHDDRAESTSALYKYAAQHWVDHAHFGNVSLHIEYGMRRLFDPAKPYFTAWLNSYDPDIEWTVFLRDDSDSFPSWPQHSKFTSLGEDDAPICLYYAALCGFRNLTEYLIIKYPQHVDATVGLNKSPLAAALCNKHIQVAELLYLHGAVLPINCNGRTLLHAASADGLAGIAQWLLDIGEDANAQADSRRTPLYFAVINGHLELVRILLDRGADVNTATTENNTPLHKASSGGHINVARLLLEHGADVHARDESQSTPLHNAPNAETVQLLIKHGADIEARDESQLTPLHVASSRANAENVQLLIENGADVHARDESQLTPLHYAQNAGTMQLLIEHGADVHVRDGSQSTPLHHMQNFETMQLLTEHGADVQARDESQATPLHIASSRVNAETVQLLIDHGADVNARDESQWTPLHRVLSRKRDIISRLAIDHGENSTAKTIQVLIENGADVNARDKSQSTPLHLASSSWDVNITKLLIKHGADVHAENQDQSTPLHIASSSSFSMNMGTTVRVLIEHGARVNAYDQNHRTPLHRVSSCWDPNSDSLRLLLENGADVDAEDNKGLTAFQIASSQEDRHDKITRLLFDHSVSMI